MRLADMRSWVRRRLFDVEGIVFTDDGLIDSALNVGAQQVQKAVMKVDPDAFRVHEYRNVVSGKYRYQKPRGMIRVKQLFVNDVEYTPGMERSIETGFYSDYSGHYVVTGGEIVITPCPDASVEDGFHLLYVPTLGMSDDDDDLDDDGLVTPLHMAVVLWAVKLLQPEGGEDTTRVDAEIIALQAEIPTYYGDSGSGAPFEVSGLGLELNE